MSTMTAQPSAVPAPAKTEEIPPLENGDRLTRDEFERRYNAMPHINKAELIEGIVYMPSPVRLRKHGKPHSDVVTWLGTYTAETTGVLSGDNSTARLDLDNEPQPDVLLMIDPARGGQAKISDDDYVEGAPELVCEIAGTTENIDLHTKLNVYRRNGVREYIVRLTRQPDLHWYLLTEGRYDRLSSDPDGLLRSRIFAGLWLDSTALLAGDMSRVLQVVRQGVASPEHADFVKSLASRIRAG